MLPYARATRQPAVPASRRHTRRHHLCGPYELLKLSDQTIVCPAAPNTPHGNSQIQSSVNSSITRAIPAACLWHLPNWIHTGIYSVGVSQLVSVDINSVLVLHCGTAASASRDTRGWALGRPGSSRKVVCMAGVAQPSHARRSPACAACSWAGSVCVQAGE